MARTKGTAGVNLIPVIRKVPSAEWWADFRSRKIAKKTARAKLYRDKARRDGTFGVKKRRARGEESEDSDDESYTRSDGGLEDPRDDPYEEDGKDSDALDPVREEIRKKGDETWLRTYERWEKAREEAGTEISKEIVYTLLVQQRARQERVEGKPAKNCHDIFMFPDELDQDAMEGEDDLAWLIRNCRVIFDNPDHVDNRPRTHQSVDNIRALMSGDTPATPRQESSGSVHTPLTDQRTTWSVGGASTASALVLQKQSVYLSGIGKTQISGADLEKFWDFYRTVVPKQEVPNDPLFRVYVDPAAIEILSDALILAEYNRRFPTFKDPTELWAKVVPSEIIRWLITHSDRSGRGGDLHKPENRYYEPARRFRNTIAFSEDASQVRDFLGKIRKLAEDDSYRDGNGNRRWRDDRLEGKVVSTILSGLQPDKEHRFLSTETLRQLAKTPRLGVMFWDRVLDWHYESCAGGDPPIKDKDGRRVDPDDDTINSKRNFEGLCTVLLRIYTVLRHNAEDYRGLYDTRDDHSRDAKGRFAKSAKGSGSNPTDTSTRSEARGHEPVKKTSTDAHKSSFPDCKGCGRQHPPPCRFVNHPGYNSTDSSWSASEKGKLYSAMGHKTLQRFIGPDGKKLEQHGSSNQRPSGDDKHRDKRSRTGTSCTHPACIDHLAVVNYNDYKTNNFAFIPLITPTNNVYVTKCLLDTGALQGNYISEEVAAWFATQGGQVASDEATRICSPVAGGTCVSSTQVLISKIGIFSVLAMHRVYDTYGDQRSMSASVVNNEVKHSFTIRLRVMKLPEGYDMILGRPTILEHGLLPQLHPELCTDSRPTDRSVLQDTEELPRHDIAAAAHKIDEGDEETLRELSDPLPWESETTTPDEAELFAEFDKRCFGSPTLKAKLVALCREFKDIFGASCRTEPSTLTPFKFEVDDSMWKSQVTRGPRPQTAVDNAEIAKQVNAMLELNIIRPSTSPYASQVLMVPKPNGAAKRFCIDLRRLNSCTKSMLWPIPNMQEMLSRIVSTTPEIFGKIDLPAGYWQVALDEACKAYTAFVTFMGVYEFNRIPMGHKNAGAYFQKEVGTDALQGLLYIICELYIDDLLIHAISEEDFILRTRKVFERFRERKLVIHMHKFSLGMSEVEFVGHVIDKSGTRFSEEKLQGVTDFPEPRTHGDIKSFVGLANFFRDHVNNLTGLIRPLQEIVKHYVKKTDKNKQFDWTPERRDSFEAVKKAIEKCQKLYYIQAGGELVLETDASEYGIASYLYQVFRDPTRICPIRFISKSLDKTQCNWSTPEKECYAIFYTLVKLEHLLRDVHFKVRTDHQNLLRAYTSGSKKVLRWRMQMQSFDIDYEHVKGEDNIVADTLSRLCPSNDTSQKERAADFSQQEVLLPSEELLMALDPLIAELNDEVLCEMALPLLYNIQQSAISEVPRGRYGNLPTDHMFAMQTEDNDPRSGSSKSAMYLPSIAEKLRDKIIKLRNQNRIQKGDDFTEDLGSQTKVHGPNQEKSIEFENNISPDINQQVNNENEQDSDKVNDLVLTGVHGTLRDDELIELRREIPIEKYRLIARVHGPVSGHLGVAKTLNKVISMFGSWKGMRKQINDFVRFCPQCQKMQVLKTQIHVTPYTLSSRRPMEEIHVDTIGPLPVDSEGNEWILTIIDACTRFVGLYPIKTVDSKHCVGILLKHIARFGYPSNIQSDKGTQFVNKMVTELALITASNPISTTPYSKEENGLVERSNREIIRHLTNLISEVKSHKDWGLYFVPLVERIMNSTVHSSIGVAPADLIYGKAINLDTNLIIPREELVKPIKISKWADDMIETQQRLLTKANKLQDEREYELIKERSQRGVKPTMYPINSFVLLDYPDSGIGIRKPSKFHPKRQGPFRIIEQVPTRHGLSYKLLNLVDQSTQTVSVNRLSPFVFDEKEVDPVKIAQIDNQEFVVEKILKHSGDFEDKKSMDFLVKYEGLDDTFNRWHEYDELKVNPKLHDYLRSIGQEGLINQRFRTKKHKK